MQCLETAEAAYAHEKVLGSDDKTVRGERRFKVIGAEVASDQKTLGAGLVSIGAPVEKRIALACLSLRLASFHSITRGLAARLARNCGNWVSVFMFRRNLGCLLDTVFSLGNKDAKTEKEVVSLPRRTAEELVLSSLFALVASCDVSVPYSRKIFATDASLNRGAVVSTEVSSDVAQCLWLGGDKKGAYTKLDAFPRACIRALGVETELDLTSAEQAEIADLNAGKCTPHPSLDFVFDFVEIFGGSGVVSKEAARLGLTVCTPIDLSRSPHFNLADLKLVNWIITMIRTKRFKSIMLEPPCTTFSPAQHPASRSYACPLGFDRLDKKTLLGNTLAFRSFIIAWVAFQIGCPTLLEQSRLSKMAWTPGWLFLVALGFREAVMASCAFGSPHKKEFRMLGAGLNMDALETRCPGGHEHIVIQGKYTRASAIYVQPLAARIAEVFADALAARERAEREEVSVAGLESLVINDLLISKPWHVEHQWAWKKPGHINVLESHSYLSLLKKVVLEGGDCRFTAVLDSRVAKGAHAKGRSSSYALRPTLQKACTYNVAGNIYPALGFAPTRLNTADAPTRFYDLPVPSDHSILDFLDFSQLQILHGFQFSKAAAGWLRMFILVTHCIRAEGFGSRPITFRFDFGLGFSLLGFLLLLCLCGVLWTSRLLRTVVWSAYVSSAPSVSHHGIFGGLILVGFHFRCCPAMPPVPRDRDEVERAARRATTVLEADRVVRPKTRSYRNTLLEQFEEWLVENLSLRVEDLTDSYLFEPERVSEILVAYGKEMFFAGRPFGRFSETINALTAKRPGLRRNVAAAWDLAFCWAADEPHEHHPALPLTILLAISSLALLWGWPIEACIFMMTWTGLLRIGEALSTRREDLILPRDAEPGFHSVLIKIRQPKTRGRAAKHQSTRIDFPDVVRLLDATFNGLSRSDLLWPQSPATLRRKFNLLLEALAQRELDQSFLMTSGPFDRVAQLFYFKAVKTLKWLDAVDVGSLLE